MPHAFKRTALLLFLLLNMADTEEPGFVFQHQGGVVQIGSCFAADYMVVFKSSGTGDQLLVNSSAGAVASFFTQDLQGRANITDHHLLLGLLMGHLGPRDEGLYRIECWRNEALVSHLRQQLVVCSEEVESKEMTVLEDGWAEVRCNGSIGALTGATVRWYIEVHTLYTNFLLLDSAVSLDPLLADMQGAVEVRDGGALLRVFNSVLRDSEQFYCAVMKGENCLSFQIINLPEYVDVKTIYTSLGDRVALSCSSEHKSQKWKTPLGKINTTTMSPASSEGSSQGGHMYISRDNESKSRSLIIPAVSDEHMGHYSCFSPSLVIEYLIALCPRVEPREKSVVEGGDILLECNLHQKAPGDGTSVQWHRDRAAGEASLIQNTTDEAAAHPGNQRRGVIMSEDGFSLKLSGLTAEDAGVYWCIVLAGKESLQSDNDTHDGDDEEEDYPYYGSFGDGYNGYDDSEDYGENGPSWLDTYTCISKQEIVLTVMLTPSKVAGRGLDSAPKDLANDPLNDATPAPASGVPGYALGAAVATGLLLVGVIATVAVM
ncbi:unnamed protein product [Lota lota]